MTGTSSHDALLLLGEIRRAEEVLRGDRHPGGGAVDGERSDERVVPVEGLAEHEEVVLAVGRQPLADLLREVAPELGLDVLHRVDAEAVEVGQLDPGRPGVDHRLLHVAAVGGQILQAAGEVAVDELVADGVVDRAAAPVEDVDVLEERRQRRHVVGARVVEEDDRRRARVAERRVRLDDAVGVELGVVLVDHLDAGGAPEDDARRVGGGVVRVEVAGGLPGAPRVAAAAGDGGVGLPVVVDVVIEELPHVVDDDVEDDLHPQAVRRGDEAAERGDVAEVGVGRAQVLHPVAVVPGEAGVAVDVLHDRGDPQGGDAQRLHVVEVVREPLPVAALVVGQRRRVDAHVVALVAVGEAVDEHLVDDLVAPVRHVGGEGDGLRVVERHAAGRAGEHGREGRRAEGAET